MRRTPGGLLSLVLLLVVARSEGLWGVVISEIHYHPADSSTAEFIELYNPDLVPRSLSGWSFSDG